MRHMPIARRLRDQHSILPTAHFERERAGCAKAAAQGADQRENGPGVFIPSEKKRTSVTKGHAPRIFITAVLALAVILATAEHGLLGQQPSFMNGSGKPVSAVLGADHPFHDHPPVGPLPPTLAAENFAFSRSAYVAYTVAGEIETILYQQPCQCLCGKYSGHKSLLDCFTSEHGVYCGVCQQEVIFCFEQNKLKRSAPQIRRGIAKSAFHKIDLAEYADKFVSRQEDPKRSTGNRVQP
jgi:hypothetical protein